MCVCNQEANLQRVQLEVKSGSDLEEVELRVIEMLDQVITDCRFEKNVEPSRLVSNVGSADLTSFSTFLSPPLFFSSEELPSLKQWQCATPLDHSSRHLRTLHMQQIVAAANALKHGPATELSTVMEQAEDWASRLRTMAEEVRGPHRDFVKTYRCVLY